MNTNTLSSHTHKEWCMGFGAFLWLTGWYSTISPLLLLCIFFAVPRKRSTASCQRQSNAIDKSFVSVEAPFAGKSKHNITKSAYRQKNMLGCLWNKAGWTERNSHRGFSQMTVQSSVEKPSGSWRCGSDFNIPPVSLHRWVSLRTHWTRNVCSGTFMHIASHLQYSLPFGDLLGYFIEKR